MNRHASMNRIYRLVWSQVRSAWVVVSEITKARGKSAHTTSASRATAAAAALSLALVPLAHAGPTGGQVVSGKGNISQAGNTTTIEQSSQSLSINWQSFNIALQQTVDFLQPSATAIAVNRILGTNGSQILGHLDANGQVYLINPNGILFGKGAEVNVGGLVASTLNVTDASPSGSTRSFDGTGVGSVINQGTITAANGGYVALLGNHVGNQGVIMAQLGTVALGAGNAVTLTFNGNSLVHLRVDRSVLKSVAENGGLIRADGGQVIVTAGAKDALLASVVNNTGVIEARTVENHDGAITLLGGMTAGTVNVGGTLDASAPEGGNGGRIETSAAHVEVADDAKVTTASSKGLYGSWLIDPSDFNVAASGGDITGTALSTELSTTPVALQSSGGATAGSGNVNVNDTVSWSANTTLTLTASNNVNVNANITATGGTAGVAINPNTANGSESASGTGTFNLGRAATINLPNVSPTSTTALIIGGAPYTVVNSLGAAGSTTGTDLQGMSGNLSGHYALGSNIDATPTATWNAGEGFAPIGNSVTPASFTGTFDGLGHSISNLTINLPSQGDVGLFGVTGPGATIRNVGLTGGSVKGAGNVGGVVGFNYYGTVSNSYFTGNVSGSGNTGGLIGFNYGGMVSNSYATGSVSGGGAGGLVGANWVGAIVSNSYATGNVTGSYGVGGLAGSNLHSTISNSYATGSVTGSSYVGGLAGSNGGTISNSYATGSVTGTGNKVGGLAGANGFHRYGSTVTNSYATGNVRGASYVGGLAGFTYGGISNSYATGNVIGSNHVGGLTGFLTKSGVSNSYATGNVTATGNSVGGLVASMSSSSIDNSYATGNVRGASYVGGLVGELNINSFGSTVSNSYATGSVTGTGSNVGGLVGFNYGTVSNSYWNTSVNGALSGIGGGTLTGATGLTAAQMQTASNFTGFNFSTTPGASGNNWVIVDSDGTLNNAGGAAGATFPMLTSEYSTSINNTHQLQLMAMNTAATYTLAQNINASATGSGTDIWSSAGFAPIGSSFAVQFTGTFEGLGHSISNLTINLPSAGNVGLFGFIGSGAAIRNLGLIGGSVKGDGNVGGLVGQSYYGTVSNGYFTGNVSGSNNVGGLVGWNYAGTVSNSYATGNVTGTDTVGGLAGANWVGTTITNSYATGKVTGSNAVGGLVGSNLHSTIGNSYATGSVTGASYVGGLAGSNGGTINNSYATGYVTGTGNNVGGLAGLNGGHRYGSTITNSYATGNVTGSDSVGGLAGFTYGSISNSYATGNVIGANVVGGLAATLDRAGVSNSYATGNVTATGNSVGGLVASMTLAGIDNSYATGNVRGASYVGGLVGQMNSFGTTVSNSYATGRVTGTGNNVGGLVGFNYGTITNSYATGPVSGSSNIGGLVGNNVGSSYGSGVIQDSYSTGVVSGTGNGVGGLVGFNSGSVSNSFWDVTTSGQTVSAAGIGMTTANMQTQANFTSATAVNGNVNPGWDFTNTWVMYDGHTYPLLRSFMTPLTVTANNASKTYNGGSFSGGNGVTYSLTPNSNLFGMVSYGGSSQGAVNVGSYAITPSGLYSNQQGYIISYASGTLTVGQLASVAWTGGATGNWSNAANWAGGAIPDFANVAAVTIPVGATVTYDSGVPGSTKLTTLKSNGNLKIAAGHLATTGNFSTAGYLQTGGVLDVGGRLTVQLTKGGVTLGNITAGSLSINSKGGAITQDVSTAVKVIGTTTLTADNGLSGPKDIRYNVTLGNSKNDFVGAVTAKGSAITLTDATALTAILNSVGGASLTSAEAMKVSGTIGTSLTTVTTGGTGSTTTFENTVVGKSLKVTSTGAVTEAVGTELTVKGEGTDPEHNENVTVNGVKGALIQ